MKVQGEHLFARSQEVVWRALLDPAILARTLPGCERLERVGDNDFKGVLNVQVGPVKGQFQGTLVLTDLVPPESYRMKLRGQGNAGFMEGEGTIRLEAQGSSTLLRYDLDAQVGGRIAGVGQRLLESSSKVVARQGLEGLERELAALPAPDSEGTTAPAAPGVVVTPSTPLVDAPAGPSPTVSNLPPAQHPSQTRLAAQFATGLLAELVPRPWRVPLVVAGLVVVALAVLLVVRACGG
jgi:uncharacterized protein